MLAVLDPDNRPVYTSRSLDGAERVLAVQIGEALPAWRVALYQPPGGSPRGTVRRQTMLFSAAFALLLVVIACGLFLTYRVMRRESEMAGLKADFVANVSHDLKTPRKEFDLLRYLVEHRGEVVTRDRLLDEVWGYEHFPTTRTVDTHVLRLRQKFERDPEHPRHIVTAHGQGYRFVG